MGDMAEVFNDMTKQKKERAIRRKGLSFVNLKERDLIVKSYTDDHLLINGTDCLIDFWPSTGRFISRDKKNSGWGLGKLLKLCPKGEGNE